MAVNCQPIRLQGSQEKPAPTAGCCISATVAPHAPGPNRAAEAALQRAPGCRRVPYAIIGVCATLPPRATPLYHFIADFLLYLMRDDYRPESALAALTRYQHRLASATGWDWEATLERSYLRLLPLGARVVDAGAHRGRHTRILVEQVQATSIWAYEPLPEEAACLRARFAPYPQVVIRNQALGAAPARSSFVVNRHAREESGLRRRLYNCESAAITVEIEVEVVALDDAGDVTGVSFVKIDVEGAELEVLAGARRLLARDRPLVAVEFGYPAYSVYGHSAGDLYHFARGQGYTPTDLLGHPFADYAEWMLGVDRYYWDYLLVPDEQLAACSARLATDAWPLGFTA